MELHIAELKKIIEDTGETLEGNCIYEDKSFNVLPELNNKQKNLQKIAEGKKNIMEIGFNGGHSCLMFLYNNPTLEKITIFDIVEHKYVIPCFEYLKKEFSNVEFELIQGDTRLTLDDYSKIPYTYDLIHMDGGHGIDVINNDIKHCKLMSKLIIVDDTNYGPINNIVEDSLKNDFKEMDMLKTYTYEHRIIYRD
tara:strand:+ start:3961 stop:4545 length:585 start_codon:yes stop_codon:yes gene_type:complete